MEEHDDRTWMLEALEEARLAAAEDEVPVGAVLVADGHIVARGHNRREHSGDPTAHAEMEALRAAVDPASPGRWRQLGATMYVTLEPCTMCMGALVLARVERLVYGCPDPKGGAAETLYRIGDDERLNHRVAVTSGILAEESADLLRSFFRRLRES